jgi:MSHA pilin protein MshD
MRAERRQSGFSLVEALVAIVVIGVALAGVISVFSHGARAAAEPVVRKQLVALTEELMDEIQLKPYAVASNTTSGCARNTFNDVSDYHGYPSSGQVCDIDGNLIAALSAYRLAITVATTTLGGITEAKLITVTASRGNEAIVLQGWRTNFAGP